MAAITSKIKGFEFRKDDDGRWRIARTSKDFKTPVVNTYNLGQLLDYTSGIIERSGKSYKKILLAVFEDD